jgi:hypothetical protein
MVKQTSSPWRRLRASIAAEPGRFAGGSAVVDPFGLLAVKSEERTAELRRSQGTGKGEDHAR